MAMWRKKPEAIDPLADEEVRRPRWALRLLVIGCVGILLVLGGRPTYHRFKAWRARALAAGAEAALAQEDLTNAVRKAQAAYLMRPDEPASLRTAARIQSRI